MRKRLAGVVTRGVVVIDKVLVIAPLFKFGIGLGPNWQLAPAGNPEHWPREIELGIGPLGVTTNWYVAVPPLVTVNVFGVA